MADRIVRGVLALVPARWREAVARDLEEERRRHGWSRVGMAWRALGIAASLRLRGRGHATHQPSRRRWLDELRRDVTFAVRLAARTPVFTGLAVVTVALGVGANAAVFGVTKAVLLDALPYADGDRLVRIYGRSTLGTVDRTALSAGAVADYAARQSTLERLGAFRPTTWEVTYRPPDGPRVLTAGYFAPGFLETLGVDLVAGRAFLDGERREYPVLLSHDLWQREFGGDPGVIGQRVHIDADRWRVVGVLPPAFTGPMGPADVWFTLDLTSALENPARARQNEYLGLVGRLRPGVTAETAARDLTAIAAALALEHPETDADRSVTVVSLRDSMVGKTRTSLVVLMGSALLVLAIACTNLAGALLSRTIGRRGEFAVRVALGAGRGRLVRQLLTESLLVAVAGLLVGALLASSALAALRGIDLPALPLYADLSLDTGAVLFAALLALATGVAIGIAPAVTTHRADTQGVLRDSARSVSEGRRPGRLRGALLAGQIALSVSLLVGAGLLARSLMAMAQEPLGFDPANVLTALAKGPIPRPDAVRKQFFADLEDRVRALPGVISVAHTNALPGPAMARRDLAIDGRGWPVGERAPLVPVVTVSDEWFRTLGIPLVGGRGFGSEDGMDTAPVVVISERLARTYWPDGRAVGARVRLGSDVSAPWAEVVGIVGNVRTDPARLTPEPVVYTPARQALLRESRIYAVRTDGDPLAIVRPMRAELRALDGSVPMSDVATLEDLLDGRLSVHRLPALLMGAFALLALLLAAVGVYALVGNLTAAREREFSLRMVLGSRRAEVGWLVLRDSGVWAIAGLAGGAVGATVVAYAVRGLLYGIAPYDPATIGTAFIAIAAAGVVAAIAPVRRSMRLDPAAFIR